MRKKNFVTIILIALQAVTIVKAENFPLITAQGTGDLFYGINPSVTVGNLFRVGTNPVTITSLGMFDAGQPGLNQSHSVGLWSTSGSLLARTDFLPGMDGFTSNGFIYKNISTPVTLQANTSYVLGAYYPTGSTDGLYVNYTGGYEKWSSVVTFNGSGRYTPDNAGFTFPDLQVGGMSYVGPNALYVPEPATILLFGLGGMILRKRK